MSHDSQPPRGESMLLPRCFYAAYYAALASLSPFLTLYYRDLDLSGSQIGLLTGITPFITLLSAPLWTGIADASQRHRRVLTTAIAGTLLSVGLLSQARAFWALLPTVGLYAFFLAPVMSLVDNTVLDMLGDRHDEYGKQRLWGAIGWSVAAPIIGFASEYAGLGVSFVGYIVFMALGLFVARQLPIKSTVLTIPYLTGLGQLFASPGWASLMGTVLLVGIGRTMGFSFLLLHLQDLGATQGLLGVIVMVASVSELPMFFYSNALLQRFGALRLLFVSIIGSLIMLLGFSLIRQPWVALLLQLFHGTSFSLMWVSAISLSNKSAPPGMGATAMGLLSAVSSGLAAAIGAILGGLLFDQFGGVGTFAAGAAVVAVGLVLFLARPRPPRSAPDTGARRPT